MTRRAADHVFLLGEVYPVPELRQPPDQPHDQIAAVGGPGRLARGVRLDPDQAVHLGLVGHVRVGDAIHEPEHVARDSPAGAGRADETVDAPEHLHAAPGVLGEVPQRVHHHVRVARAQLDDQVAAALSRVQDIVGERKHRREPGRQPGGQPVAVIEQGGSHGDGHGEAVGHHGRPEHAGIRRCSFDADGRRITACGQEPGSGGDRLEQVDQFAAALGGDVERDHRGLALRLRQDARLVPAVEGHRWQQPRLGVLQRDLAGGSGPGSPVGEPAGRARHRPGRARARAQQERAATRAWLCLLLGLLLGRDGFGHHVIRGSVMAAIGDSSSRAWPQAASISSRLLALSWETPIHVPFGLLS